MTRSLALSRSLPQSSPIYRLFVKLFSIMIGRWNNYFLLPRQSIETRQGGGVRVETMDFLCRECVAVSGTMDLLCRGEGGGEWGVLEL